jgi:HSP20 family protein
MSNEMTPKPTATQLDNRQALPGVMFTPHVDVLETDDELLLLADVPGVQPESIDVRFERGQLSLHGRCPARQAHGAPVSTEYAVGDFYRAFAIQADVDADKIAAELKNGELTVHLPKAAKARPKRISVQGR